MSATDMMSFLTSYSILVRN